MAYGTVQADVMGTSVAGSNLGAGNASIMKNRIINGAMVIDQRNAGASVTPTDSQYLVDRWNARLNQSGKYTAQQNAGSVTPPAGFVNYLGMTSTSAYSVGASDYFFVNQIIEGYNIADLAYGTASAKTVTISAYVYSSLTGTFGGVLFNPAASKSYPFTFTISSTNTWTQISVTIPGDTAGATNTTNNSGFQLRFGLGVGSSGSASAGSWQSGNYFSATGAVSVVGTNGATFYFTGVQLEVGSSATGYEYRQYGQELALCQRYYYKVTANSTSNSHGMGVGVVQSSSGAGYCITSLPVNMRAIPTISQSGCRLYNGNTAASITSISSNRSSPMMMSYDVSTGSSSFSAGQCGQIIDNGNLTDYVDASAEL